MSKAEQLGANETQFFNEARTWDEHRIATAERSRTTAWCVAGSAALIAAAAVFAVAALTPLHRVEPYVVRVDDVTGQVDVVSTLRETKEEYGEAVTKHFLLRYLIARESYSRQAAATNYEHVNLFSEKPVARRYYEDFRPENPESPLAQYGTRATVELKVKSIAFIGEKMATVRYTKEVHFKSSDKPERSQWVATIGFRYSSASMQERDRLENPLGFQVTEYRTDPDNLEGR